MALTFDEEAWKEFKVGLAIAWQVINVGKSATLVGDFARKVRAGLTGQIGEWVWNEKTGELTFGAMTMKITGADQNVKALGIVLMSQ